MAINVKSLGNSLAMKSRGLEGHMNQQMNPENMPVDEQGAFEVPAAALPGVAEGDTLTVVSVGETVTLEKAAPPVEA
jgi:hypothetical protein